MQATFDPQRFRQALGAFTTGVAIVTTVDAAGASVGMTANSFNSVSLTPPMVLWSLGRTSSNSAAFLQAKHFAVHILAADQEALAAKFSQRGVDRFAGLSLARGLDGIPLLHGCAARFECRTAFQYEGGDHVICVGEVLGFEHWDREPLVFKRGRFALAVDKTAAAAELDTLAAYTGTRIADESAQQLLKRGLVKRDNESQPSALSLTDTGRRTVVELLAIAQAASVDGEKSLDSSESLVLRRLLAKII